MALERLIPFSSFKARLLFTILYETCGKLSGKKTKLHVVLKNKETHSPLVCSLGCRGGFAWIVVTPVLLWHHLGPAGNTYKSTTAHKKISM